MEAPLTPAQPGGGVLRGAGVRWGRDCVRVYVCLRLPACICVCVCSCAFVLCVCACVHGMRCGKSASKAEVELKTHEGSLCKWYIKCGCRRLLAERRRYGNEQPELWNKWKGLVSVVVHALGRGGVVYKGKEYGVWIETNIGWVRWVVVGSLEHRLRNRRVILKCGEGRGRVEGEMKGGEREK